MFDFIPWTCLQNAIARTKSTRYYCMADSSMKCHFFISFWYLENKECMLLLAFPLALSGSGEKNMYLMQPFFLGTQIPSPVLSRIAQSYKEIFTPKFSPYFSSHAIHY